MNHKTITPSKWKKMRVHKRGLAVSKCLAIENRGKTKTSTQPQPTHLYNMHKTRFIDLYMLLVATSLFGQKIKRGRDNISLLPQEEIRLLSHYL